jgi:predicted ferric reductase
VLGIGGAIARLQEQGASAAAIAMGRDMDMRDMSRYWAFPWLQASGLVAMAGMFLAAPMALWASLRGAQGAVVAGWLRAHRQLSVAVVVLVCAHVVLTALDNMGDSWRTVLIPGAWAALGWPEAVTGYNTGILAMYAMLVFAGSYYFGGLRLGSSRWALLHRLMLVAYASSVWHALSLGLDVAFYGWIRPFIWLWQLPCLGLLALRALQAARASARVRSFTGAGAWCALGAASGAAFAAVAWVVLSGNFDCVRTV